MSRRVWFVVAVLAAALALASTAAARPVHRLGGLRHGVKPTRKHVIAVRHGRHIIWFSRTHGLPKHRLPPIKLSPDVTFRVGIRAFGPTSAPNVTKVGTCTLPTQSSPDGMDFVQSYGNLFADALNCVGNTGGNTESNTFFPYPDCSNNFPQSVHSSPGEYATFMDGEAMLLCTVPDDNGSGGSEANSQAAPYVVYQQGFPCQAAVGTGPSGNSAFIAKTKDSLEYSQTYTENSQSDTALTTSCIGKLPSGKTAPSTAVAHLVSCTQYDPKAPGKFVKGLGETITYPDGQFQETCNVPDYRSSVVCAGGTSCSTDVSADQTSNLHVTEGAETDGTLTETVDYGTPLSCVPRQYGLYTGFDPNWYGFAYTGLDASGSKVLVYDLFTLPFNGDNNVEFCFGATQPFQAASDDGASQAGTLPDGTPGFIGLLRNCEDTDGPQPCLESVQAIDTDTGGTEVRVDIPATFSADPFGHI